MSLDLEQIDAIDSRLGNMGTMLSGSKTERPGQRIVWNANVVTKNIGKIWFGDIDLNAKGDALAELAVIFDEPVYVLRELDARFDFENDPRYDRAVEIYEP